MRIAFYAPFKPLDHANPSGDRAIGRSIRDFLTEQGHTVTVVSRLRARWITMKPWLWPVLAAEALRVLRRFGRSRPDLWLTYHSYWKAPDLLGPWICRSLNIPYVIVQGIYSTKRRKKLKSLPGFLFNRAALLQADQVATNRCEDLKNLKRLLPEDRLSYIRPGIVPGDFVRDEVAGKSLRRQWGAGSAPVILSAAMFRDDVKTRGLSWMITCLKTLAEEGSDFRLVIAGAGVMEPFLRAQASNDLPGRVTFAGKIPREAMDGFYSSGDIFVFPGIRESLGMVFLEAQACGLPVVAFDNGGIPEVVDRDRTGFLTPVFDCQAFRQAVRILLENETLRTAMGNRAAVRVRQVHDLHRTYQALEILVQKAFRS